MQFNKVFVSFIAIAYVSFFGTAYAGGHSVDSNEPVLTYGNPDKLSNENPTVLITGSNRGIGLEFVKQFSERGWNIIATARKPVEATDLQEIAAGNERIVIEQLDVTDFERIGTLANKYGDRSIDLLLSNAGITPKYKSAFRTVSGVDWDMARQSMEVNAIAPVRIAQAFMGQVAASDQKKIVVISSKAGSFAEGPEMPMMYSYRASKAALNMLIYTLSFETAKRDVTLTLMSPGQVNTTPGFKMKIAIEPDESVSKMLKVIDGLSIEDNGKFLDYEDGRVIPW
jgi:NAD(P)-dependent dehydrogenase (short-subunit alcohol dehydrogenase family)